MFALPRLLISGSRLTSGCINLARDLIFFLRKPFLTQLITKMDSKEFFETGPQKVMVSWLCGLCGRMCWYSSRRALCSNRDARLKVSIAVSHDCHEYMGFLTGLS
jgi:hypothetical protein